MKINPFQKLQDKKPTRLLIQTRQKYRTASIGFRETKYRLFQDTLKYAMEIQLSRAARENFAKVSKLGPPKLAGSNKMWVALAAFKYVTGSRKVGWKAYRVTEFLHKIEKVPLEKLADEMQKRGGIEKIIKFAAANDSKQSLKNKTEKSAIPSSVKRSGTTVKISSENSTIDDDDWGDKDLNQHYPDKEVKELLLTLKITLEQFDELRLTQIGSKVRLTCERLDASKPPNVLLKVTKFRGID